jgi:hypothetical protein
VIETFQSGAVNGQVGCLAGIDANWDALSVSSVSSGEVVVEDWVRRASRSDSSPTPSNSCSSFSSTRCSLRKLLFVLVLAKDSVRLRGVYRLRQAVIPEPIELIDDAED